MCKPEEHDQLPAKHIPHMHAVRTPKAFPEWGAGTVSLSEHTSSDDKLRRREKDVVVDGNGGSDQGLS